MILIRKTSREPQQVFLFSSSFLPLDSDGDHLTARMLSV